MKHLFNDLSKIEKNQILEMHKSATKRNYLSEQVAATFNAEGVIEGDMLMKFPVTNFNHVYGNTTMYMTDPISKKSLYVVNFKGPIMDAQTNKPIYKSSTFNNINEKNWESISRQFKVKTFET